MFRLFIKIIAISLAFCGFQGGITAEDKPIAPVKTLLNENRIEEAVAVCRQYEVLSTRDRDDRFACAWVYLRNNQLESAEKILEEQKANSKSAEYQLIRGYSLVVQKKYDEAKKIFESVAASNKGRSYALQAQELIAEMYEFQDKLAPAGFIYNLVLKEEPNRGRSAWGLARFYQSQNDIRRCIQYLELTAKLWPKHIASRFLLAKIHFSLGPEYVSEGFNWLKESYRLNRTNPEVLEEIGSFFERKNKIPEAVKYWQKALSIKPDLALANEKVKEYFSQTIQQLFDSEKYDELIEKLEANKTLSETSEMLLIKGQSYRNINKFDQAIITLKQFLKSEPKNPLANRELGIAYLNQKAWDLAAEAFSKAVINEPNNGINYGWFAYALEEKGELAKAKEYWEKSLALIDEPEQREKANRKIASITKRLKNRKKSEEDDE
ncbi:MAG: tetratricopeptide repeat protein [Deltaproteobacteria bacterium]|jgi:tetratricopeptide (TPR) repeat protein